MNNRLVRHVANVSLKRPCSMSLCRLTRVVRIVCVVSPMY